MKSQMKTQCKQYIVDRVGFAAYSIFYQKKVCVFAVTHTTMFDASDDQTLYFVI